MGNLLQSVYDKLFTKRTDPIDNNSSSLKRAFEQSRSQKNIELVLPVLLNSSLFVITGGENDYFLVKSPNKERFCVTVSESLNNLAEVEWPKIQISGETLIRNLPEGIEIVITYKDGGDYITREQLAWYRELLKPVQSPAPSPPPTSPH
jgi:fimbrial chaperone protein